MIIDFINQNIYLFNRFFHKIYQFYCLGKKKVFKLFLRILIQKEKDL